MEKNRFGSIDKLHLRYVLVFSVLLFLFVLLFIFNINTGSVSISIEQILRVLSGKDETAAAYKIIWSIRLPRMLAALFLGGALSISGFLLQTFFHNPIASPFVLGISSGAKLVVAVAMLFFINIGWQTNSTVLIIAAFVGSMICMGFILLFSKKAKNMSTLIVGGIMVGYICSAMTDFIITFANDADIVNLHNWSMGSFSGMSWDNVGTIAVVVSIASIGAFLLSKPMNAFQLGEAYAQSVGVNIKLFRVLLILISGFLSACVTAFAGPVSFVGIAVPHLIKSFLNTSKPIIVIPMCFLGGAVCCLFCDLIARTIFAPTEVSISSVTAIFGAPIVIIIMLQQKRNV